MLTFVLGTMLGSAVMGAICFFVDHQSSRYPVRSNVSAGLMVGGFIGWIVGTTVYGLWELVRLLWR